VTKWIQVRVLATYPIFLPFSFELLLTFPINRNSFLNSFHSTCPNAKVELHIALSLSGKFRVPLGLRMKLHQRLGLRMKLHIPSFDGSSIVVSECMILSFVNKTRYKDFVIKKKNYIYSVHTNISKNGHFQDSSMSYPPVFDNE
jgi:hypothetical protein